ncbi:hypothetical protein [Salinicoccus sp. YB14-2]|uniref:hypothetical protein n=1 Tax=Salinicoccus sp. YB14-2 TaxID=1572701 RepID=UPI00068C8F2F|nr:hypothetical protein [Salinicoccus sp. YB14-2]
MDIFTIVIIIIALVLISIIFQMLRVRQKPKVKLEVKNENIMTDDFEDEKLYRFSILNDSNQSIVIESIQLYSNGVEIFDNGHHPGFKASEQPDRGVVAIDSKRVRDISDLLSENFLGTTVVRYDEEMTYSYYLDAAPDEIKVTVRENECIEIMLKPEF